jgi:hypothetical protein
MVTKPTARKSEGGMADIHGDEIEVEGDKSCNGPKQLWSKVLNLMYEALNSGSHKCLHLEEAGIMAWTKQLLFPGLL